MAKVELARNVAERPEKDATVFIDKLPAILTEPLTMAEVPLKNKLLNQLPAAIVKLFAPELTVKFGALVVEPPVVPKFTEAVAELTRVNPPVPV